jgi:hypothetical protein
LPPFFSFALEHAARNVQEEQVGPKLNGTHQLLICAVDKSLYGSQTDTVNKNTETAIKDVGLEVNTEKTKYVLMFRHQNT